MKHAAATSVRAPAIAYRHTKDGVYLHCEQLLLSDIAARLGTPLYVYSASIIAERLRTFDFAFRSIPHTICYSVKANSNLSVLALLGGKGTGFDVVSGGELARVLHVSRGAAKKTVFSGVGKTRDEMHAALHAGILLFNVESESELNALAQCACGVKKIAQLAFRVNPDVFAKTHPYISTGLREHKFGVPINDARRLYAKAAESRWLKVAGVSVHIGSQISDAAPFTAAMRHVAELLTQLRQDGHDIKYVDAGGGLGINYHEGSTENFGERARAYAQAVLQPLKQLRVHLLLEPGRAIVGPAGVLLTRVIYKKSNRGKTFVVSDAAMNDLLRPSLYGAYHEIVPVQKRGGLKKSVDVVGPVCETGDFLAENRILSAVNEGDLLAVLDVGAYGMVLASNYNSRPRPAEVLVSGKSAKVIRRRETEKDQMALEK